MAAVAFVPTTSEAALSTPTNLRQTRATDDSKVRGHSERSRMDKRDRDHNGGIFIEKLQKGRSTRPFLLGILLSRSAHFEHLSGNIEL